MRSGKRDAKDMRDLAAIRAVQGLAAELDAARAADRVRTLSGERARCAESLGRLHQGWAAAVEGGSCDPGLARHWYRSAESERAEEDRLAKQEQAAEAELKLLREAWQQASARSQAAHDRARAASRKARRRREESRLNALEDRAASRKRP
jgi:hypothetical protein